MKIFITLLFISLNALALDAVVTVLETPMLDAPNLDANVVQYLRKGDVIKVHPAISNITKYDHLAPTPEKLAQIQNEIENSPEWKEDHVFSVKSGPVNDTDEFIPTLDRQGRKVWIIREHFYIYYENQKELDQIALAKDPTDYRLHEPLPKNYPLNAPTGYRGILGLGVSQPYFESYPYNSSVKTKGYMSPIDLSIALMRVTPDDKQDRFFFGGVFNFRYFNNEYALTSNRHSSENGLRFGLGPYITYDAYKGEENRISLYGSITVNFFNQILITQSDNFGHNDERIYRSFNLSPRMGFQYHRKKIVNDIDFVLGTAIELEPATTFRAKNGAEQPSWWQHGGNDKFTTRTTFTMVAFLGFQQAY